MKIGYDAKRAFSNFTGLGNYSRWLIKSVASFYPEYQYLLYTPKIKPDKRLDFLHLLGSILTVLPSSKIFTSWWRTKGIVNDLKRDNVDLYHGLSHELPIGINSSGIKSVVTIHDLIFMRFPQYYGAVSRAIYKLKVKYACEQADKIIAISQKTKDDIIELLNINAEKIEVIYQGCDPAFKRHRHNEEKAAISRKYNLPETFILTVGTIEERKNLALIIKALPLLKQDIKLVVIGRKTPYFNTVWALIVKNKLEERVRFLQDVSFDDLPVIYQAATLFVYPSTYEGFGIPVLEALNSGIPVIAATGSCLEEAGGPDSLYVSPDDEVTLAKKIDELLSDQSLKENMIAQGLKYALNFDDQKLTAQLMQLYKTH
jgi:glycosyltransferase involved in cell wall biosynthesis